MKDWIKDNKGTIIFLAKQGLLSTQLCGPLTKWQEEFLENEVDKLIENAPIIDENFDEQIKRFGEDDFRNSYAAELVYSADQELIEDFQYTSIGAHSINFAEMSKEATFVGDKLVAITDKISEIIDGFEKDNLGDENFILCSPLIASILQSVCRGGEFELAEKESWKGPNYAHLIGHLNGVKLYTHLNSPTMTEHIDIVFVGNYNPITVKTTIHKINITNLELA